MRHNEIARIIVDTAFHIHKTLGPGLLESVYHEILKYELESIGLHVAKEVPIPVTWKQVTMELGFRADLIVEEKVIVEIKSLEKLNPVHSKQLLTYLKIADKRLGLLVNFGEQLIKNGIHRIVNQLEE
ncbi:MAG: GxxExxY protein [candidate division KSB1 bacterium]|nr:GxxExxY protein [candidate division KSB1 bacterium]